MSDEPQSEPRKSSFGCKVVFFFLAFALSLGIGRAFEYLTAESTYEAALKLQQGWFNSVSTMAPLSLATNYFDDVMTIATSGKFPTLDVARVEPADIAARQQQTKSDDAVRCRLLPTTETAEPQRMTDPGLLRAAEETNIVCGALSMSRKACLPGYGSQPYSECIAEQDKINERFERECAGWEAGTQRQFELNRELPRLTAEGEFTRQHQSEDRSIGKLLSAPAFALFHTWTRLTAPGGISYFWAVLQLGTGLIGFLALYGPLFGDRARGIDFPEGFGGWAIGVPIGTIVVASLTAMVLKYLMLFGLYLFCQVTSFAAFCCAATGTIGICWYWATKLAEFGAGAALTPNDPK